MSTALAKIDFTQDEMAVIRRQFFPASGTPEEQNYCFSVARHLGLNPITKEIFFVPRRQKVGSQWVEKIEPMVGRDGFLSIAHRSNQLAGMETTAGIREVPTMAGGSGSTGKSWSRSAGCGGRTPGSRSQSRLLLRVRSEEQRRPANPLLGGEAGDDAQEGGRIAGTPEGVQRPRRLLPGGGRRGLPRRTTARSSSPRATGDTKAIGPEEPFPEEPLSETVEGVWPPSVPARTPAPRRIDEIAAMLAAKNIKHEIDADNGYITARSYNNKEFLKSLGFRWEPEIKAWVWTDVMDAA
jgi:hypothetical protein